MKGFGVFVDFASSKGNQTTKLLVLFESTGVPSVKNKLATRPGSNLFWGIFLTNVEQWNVDILFF
jgi:hypothetical protein